MNKITNETNSPQLDVNINIPNLDFQLENKQYAESLELFRLWQLFKHDTLHPHSNMRPNVSAKQDPKAWWKYISKLNFQRIFIEFSVLRANFR